MASSGTNTFQMTVDEIIAEAYEQLGVIPSALTGYDLKSARLSLSLLLIEFANRNIWAYQSKKDSFPTVASTAVYTLDATANDIRYPTINVAGSDIELDRKSYAEYAGIPNKTQTGRPTQAYIDRKRDSVTMTLWPVPDAIYTVNYEEVRKIEDVGAYTNNLDIPDRALPAIIAGLAYKLAKKRPTLVQNPDGSSRLGQLKGDADESFAYAVEDDQDRISTVIVPDMRSRR